MEAAVKAAAEGAGAQLRAFWGATLAHLEDLPFRLAQLPQSFGAPCCGGVLGEAGGWQAAPVPPATVVWGALAGGRSGGLSGSLPPLMAAAVRRPLPPPRRRLPGADGGRGAARRAARPG